MSNHLLRQTCVSMAIGLSCASASAQDLVSLVNGALASEPSLMSARSELNAAQARYDQSVGGLLPQVRASANTRLQRAQLHHDAAARRPQGGRSGDRG